MTDYISLAIVGAAVSLFVQFVKSSSWGRSRAWTIALVISCSLGAGLGYWYMNGTAIWEASLQILLIANGIYAFLIKQFQS